MLIKRNPPEQKSKRGSIKMKKTFPMLLPGKEFMDQVYGGGKPSEPGVYLVYYDSHQAHSTVVPRAGATIANWDGEKWGINYKVYAFMGPIPLMELKSLMECTPGYCINQIFYIATLKQGAHNQYSSGPHAEYLLAFLQPGETNQFIFCLNSENPYPLPITKFVPRYDNFGWKSLSTKAQKKYSKMMESLRK